MIAFILQSMKGEVFLKISTRGRYGLRAMTELAMHSEEKPLPLKEIAKRQGISDSYLEQVFATLRKAGLVTAVRGSFGGYALTKPPEEISVYDVLYALEGPLVPVDCVIDDGYHFGCDRLDNCVTYPFWRELASKIDEIMKGVSIRDLIDRAAKDASANR